MGSRGSIIPYFQSLAASGEIPITDERMTRFMITLEEGVELVWHALEDSMGGEVYVKKIPSMKIVDIAKAIAPGAKLKIIGIRPGEKIHEEMICPEDAFFTYEYESHYKITSSIYNLKENDSRFKGGVRCPEGFHYSSDKNKDWMTEAELQTWIKKEYNHNTL
jgi:FlaA1/EpsC-like NDP-sugar epimerase